MKKRYLFRSFSLLIALALLLISGVSTSSAFSGEDNLQQTSYEKLNLLILVKASQSSNRLISNLSDSKTKLEIIQDSIPSVLDQYSLPSNVDIGIMAYGHLIDKSEFNSSCSSDNVELLVPLQPAPPTPALGNFLSITGLGEVTAAVALEEAGEVFTEISPEILNVILLIADGSDTCNQDPVFIARVLTNSKNITIYTIGFMADTKASSELENIASETSGEYRFISPFIDNNDEAKDELTKELLYVFDNLLSQISEPLPTKTFTATEEAPFTPTSTPTEMSPSTQPVTETTAPISTEEPPSTPSNTIGILFIATLFFLSALGFGYWYWKLRLSPIKVDKKLEKFREDLFTAYDSIEAEKHYPKFIPVEVVKEQLSDTYSQEQFDELLAQARRTYPNKIWIDRDAKNKPVFIKIVGRS